MRKVVFTDAQIEAAQDLSEKLYDEWATENDVGVRILAPAFLLAAVAAVTAPDQARAQKLIETIARHAVEALIDTPVPENVHGKLS